MIVEHIAVDDTWLVKTGDHGKITDAIAEDEHDAVASNRLALALRRAFDIGEIEFGRADHATVGGQMVIYEINTNPYAGRFVPDRLAGAAGRPKLSLAHASPKRSLPSIQAKAEGSRFRAPQCAGEFAGGGLDL